MAFNEGMLRTETSELGLASGAMKTGKSVRGPWTVGLTQSLGEWGGMWSILRATDGRLFTTAFRDIQKQETQRPAGFGSRDLTRQILEELGLKFRLREAG